MSINILPFPDQVVRGIGAIDQAGDICKKYGRRVLVIGGKTALEIAEERITISLKKANVEIVGIEWYGGECSKNNIDNLVKKVECHKADIILAVGGGKAMDTGKAIGVFTKLPVITIPTIAATCAAVTPLTVLYNEKGEFVENMFYDVCPTSVIIDSDIILNAPSKWLIAGIGDTLAKMYELRAAAKGISTTSSTISAVSNGEICYNIIKKFGKDARMAVETKKMNDGFEATVDAIIVIAGLSSIFGGEEIRNAAAHGIYNGFTKIPVMHTVAHGLIVGYGNLCLLALEERSDVEILEEIELALDCGIPTTLNQLAELSEDEIKIGAEASAVSKAMSCMPFTVSADMVIRAIKRVDNLAMKASQ
ncbi:iron-containing alcohol dehydrogenase family protein [Candidatus Clostridium helianthi]|jgi:Glycerol dehydrogenase and related enzymes|uniref:Iron-containing alcohol dehydrogenase family protein n=1 Tax=Candidatus Clostridium helianthi TaxID=3381660 RepID=A0ABW8SEU9_9CLOT